VAATKTGGGLGKAIVIIPKSIGMPGLEINTLHGSDLSRVTQELVGLAIGHFGTFEYFSEFRQ